MRSLRSKQLREFVTFMLAVSVSICCCQAHFLLHGLPGTPSDLDSTVAAESGGCCVNCTEDEPEGDRPQAPVKSCKTCCVKGTGLKDGVTIPPIDVADVLPAVAEPPVLRLARSSIPTPRFQAPPPFVEPRTLVRMHCALLV